jgi:hypothetical protein
LEKVDGMVLFKKRSMIFLLQKLCSSQSSNSSFVNVAAVGNPVFKAALIDLDIFVAMALENIPAPGFA